MVATLSIHRIVVDFEGWLRFEAVAPIDALLTPSAS